LICAIGIVSRQCFFSSTEDIAGKSFAEASQKRKSTKKIKFFAVADFYLEYSRIKYRGLVILLYTLSQRNRGLGLEWSVMERGEAGSR